MPTVLVIGPYRFYFYSHETTEPPHIHVDRDQMSAKYWLRPFELARNIGFSPRELRDIRVIVSDNRFKFMEAWNGYFGSRGR
jgi:hypothetical protein